MISDKGRTIIKLGGLTVTLNTDRGPKKKEINIDCRGIHVFFLHKAINISTKYIILKGFIYCLPGESVLTCNCVQCFDQKTRRTIKCFATEFFHLYSFKISVY